MSLAIYSGCSKVDVSDLPSTASAAIAGRTESADSSNGSALAEACSAGQKVVDLPVQILFLVDQSGSNVSGALEGATQGTDPQKIFRSGVMSQFLEAHKSQSSLGWGIISFRQTAAKSLLSPLQSSKIFGSATEFRSAMQIFGDSEDEGATPYRAALTKAQDMIQQDLASQGSKSANHGLDQRYLVIMMTDGYPTDYCADPKLPNCSAPIDENQIRNDVKHLIKLGKPGHIQFSTVYYGQPDPAAEKRLAGMAAQGQGLFVNTNIDSTVALTDKIAIPVQNCP